MDQRQQLLDNKNLFEIIKSKLLSKEATIKNQNQIIEKLQFENDDLNQKIILFEHELADKENLESQLAGKNNEIVRLERSLTETQIVFDYFGE